MHLARFVTVISSILLLATSTSARTLIHAGTVIDGISDKPATEMTIVIDADRIVEIHVVDGFVVESVFDSVLVTSTRPAPNDSSEIEIVLHPLIE